MIHSPRNSSGPGTLPPPSRQTLATYQTPAWHRSVWQLTNSVFPYLALWALMVATREMPYWVTLALAIPAAGFLVRIFIIFHDCCHGSFFRSRRATDFWGFVTGLLTLTPYQQWRHTHARHHATSGDLDRRGEGDIWTLTVDEYLKSPAWRRLAYRVVRNPLVLFVVAPLYLFIIRYRLPARGSMRRERLSVHGTNAALVGIVLVMALTIGWEAFLSIQLPVSMLSAAVGMWLFYVQHQFEGVYWERREKWEFAGAAVNGSSFYRLPRILQWFTGNIGFHHVHHLNPAIPNYNLERCHQEQPMLRTVRPLTLFASLRSLTFRLWDEQRQRLVGYAGVRAARRERRRAARSGGALS